MEFGWSDEDEAFRSDLEAFLEQTLPDDWAEMSKDGPGSDTQAAFSKQFCRKLAEKGWLTQHWPTEFGGKDAAPWRHAILSERLWAMGEPRGAQYMNVNWIGPAIMEHGTEEQKAHHLPLISSGQVLWCQGFSEPEAGSDLVALRTAALRNGDDYVVNGSKIWTSYANHADYCFLLVRTDPDSVAAQGHLGAAGAHGHAGHRGARDPLHRGRPLLPRGLLQRRPRAGELPARTRSTRAGTW